MKLRYLLFSKVEIPGKWRQNLPAFGHQVSLGQSNTVILCPSLTSHSELSVKELEAAGISTTTIRVAMGDEDPRQLIGHLIRVAELVIDPTQPGFSQRFMQIGRAHV